MCDFDLIYYAEVKSQIFPFNFQSDSVGVKGHIKCDSNVFEFSRSHFGWLENIEFSLQHASGAPGEKNPPNSPITRRYKRALEFWNNQKFKFFIKSWVKKWSCFRFLSSCLAWAVLFIKKLPIFAAQICMSFIIRIQQKLFICKFFKIDHLKYSQIQSDIAKGVNFKLKILLNLCFCYNL